MPYRYLDDIATADAAFEAVGETLEALFTASAEAVINVMVANPGAIEPRRQVVIREENEAIDLLLFQMLQELIYYKDAEQLLLRIQSVKIKEQEDLYALEAVGSGEPIDPDRHELQVDVKAVTLHLFQVERNEQGWKATVVLDI